MHTSFLHGLFPTARFVHVMRDGRDVAASLVSKNWKSDPLVIHWWETRMRLDPRVLRPAPKRHHPRRTL